jgi:hypothetical protein
VPRQSRAIVAGMRHQPLSIAILALLAACRHDDTDAVDTDAGYQPDVACPGGPDCPSADGALEVGTATVSIVPACYEQWVDVTGDGYWQKNDDTYLDCGCDHLCPGDDGYTAPDTNEGNGVFDARWMAGFGTGRPMNGVRGPSEGLRGEGDGLEGRAIVLRKGETSVAIVALDTIGWFNDDVVAVREALAADGVDVDHLVVHAIHDHEGLDTMGIWGEREFERGYQDDFQQQLRAQVEQLVVDALADARPVDHVVIGSTPVSGYNQEFGAANVVGDLRDPYIVDEDLGALAFYGTDGSILASMVNFAQHPESMSDVRPFVSGDYVHALRLTVESGSQWQGSSTEGIGGTCIFLNGALGGMMSPLHLTVHDPDGNAWRDSGYEKGDADGQLLGEMALDALAHGETVTDLDLAFWTKSFDLPIDNIAFQAMFNMGVLYRDTFNWDSSQPITEENTPWLRTELDVVQLGPLQMLTIPGEPLPELAIGGYDGSNIHSPGIDIFEADNPNPPDLANAPAGPYWKDEFRSEHRWIVGLGNDELGYIVPAYNFVVSDSAPYLVEADGDHYEETNSLGPRTAPLIDAEVAKILAWSP